MNDWFGTPVLPGLSSRDDLVTRAEEQALIERIDGTSLSPFRFQGWTGKRLTSSYGWSYDFDAGRLQHGDPMPDWLLPIRNRAAVFAGLRADDLVQLCSSAMIRAPASGGTRIGRPSSTSSVFRWARRRQCASGDASVYGSSARRLRSRRAAPTI